MAVGMGTVAYSRASKSMGYRTQTGVPASAGQDNTPGIYIPEDADGNLIYQAENKGQAAAAFGSDTVALANNDFAQGYKTKAIGGNSHAEGSSTIASGTGSHSEGQGAEAQGSFSHAEGCKLKDTEAINKAIGTGSHAEGGATRAKGYGSHTEGSRTTTEGNYSHAEGHYTIAIGNYSHAEGHVTNANYKTTASGLGAHAEGDGTTASGENSHSEGYRTTASGKNSHAEGNQTIAAGDYSHVQGKFNIEDTNNKYAHIVGNGNSDNRSNAHTLDWDGNAWFAGDVSCKSGNDQITMTGLSDKITKLEEEQIKTETGNTVQFVGGMKDYPIKVVTTLPESEQGYNELFLTQLTQEEYEKNEAAFNELDNGNLPETNPNLFGGIILAETIADRVPTAILKKENKTINFSMWDVKGSQSHLFNGENYLLPINHKLKTREFKRSDDGVYYTFILKGYNSYGDSETEQNKRQSNIRLVIEGNEVHPTLMFKKDDETSSWCVLLAKSTTNKPIKELRLVAHTGYTRLEYEYCGIFEGDIFNKKSQMSGNYLHLNDLVSDATIESKFTKCTRIHRVNLANTCYSGTYNWLTGELIDENNKSSYYLNSIPYGLTDGNSEIIFSNYGDVSVNLLYTTESDINIGDIKTSINLNLNTNDWVLCNGDEFLETEYPGLFKLIQNGVSYYTISSGNNFKIKQKNNETVHGQINGKYIRIYKDNALTHSHTSHYKYLSSLTPLDYFIYYDEEWKIVSIAYNTSSKEIVVFNDTFSTFGNTSTYTITTVDYIDGMKFNFQASKKLLSINYPNSNNTYTVKCSFIDNISNDWKTITTESTNNSPKIFYESSKNTFNYFYISSDNKPITLVFDENNLSNTSLSIQTYRGNWCYWGNSYNPGTLTFEDIFYHSRNLFVKVKDENNNYLYFKIYISYGSSTYVNPTINRIENWDTIDIKKIFSDNYIIYYLTNNNKLYRSSGPKAWSNLVGDIAGSSINMVQYLLNIKDFYDSNGAALGDIKDILFSDNRKGVELVYQLKTNDVYCYSELKRRLPVFSDPTGQMHYYIKAR